MNANRRRALTRAERCTLRELGLGTKHRRRPPTPEEQAWLATPEGQARLAHYRKNPADLQRQEREAKRARRDIALGGELFSGEYGAASEEILVEHMDGLERVRDHPERVQAYLDAHPGKVRSLGCENPAELFERLKKNPMSLQNRGRAQPTPERKKPRGIPRKTSVQRAAAHMRGEIGSALREQALGVLLGVKMPTAGKPTRLDLDRLEQAQRAAAMVSAARDFYAKVKHTWPSRAALKKMLATFVAKSRAHLETHKRAVDEARAGRLNGRDFAAKVFAAWHPPSLPVELQPALRLAAAIVPHTGGAVKDLGAERGPNAGGGWRGNVKITVSVAGLSVNGRLALVNRTRTAELELLAPTYVEILYRSGHRSGPKESAKAVVANMLKRSSQGIEAMLADASASEISAA